MKRLILAVFCAVVTFVCPAQNNRVVNGSVLTAEGTPLSVAVLKAVGTELTFTPKADGTFLIQIPYFIKMVEASAEGYLTEQIEVDGSYMVFKLKVDKKYLENKAKAEEEARKASEAKAKEEAVAKLAAEKEAIEKARAEAEAARIIAEKGAANKAWAEEQARARAEAAAAKAKADSLAKVRAEKRAERLARTTKK